MCLSRLSVAEGVLPGGAVIVAGKSVPAIRPRLKVLSLDLQPRGSLIVLSFPSWLGTAHERFRGHAESLPWQEHASPSPPLQQVFEKDLLTTAVPAQRVDVSALQDCMRLDPRPDTASQPRGSVVFHPCRGLFLESLVSPAHKCTFLFHVLALVVFI